MNDAPPTQNPEPGGALRQFLTAWAGDPRGIGAIAPSSRRLGRTMASFVADPRRLVVEVGAGTGPVTEALLEHGVPASSLVAIERSERLADHLQGRFPGVRVIEGDAAQIGTYIGADAVGEVGAVVSSLPLRSLPREICRSIVGEIERVLAPDGVVIQFTYDPRQGDFYRESFVRVRRRWVWTNLPPARVDVFHKKGRLSSSI